MRAGVVTSVVCGMGAWGTPGEVAGDGVLVVVAGAGAGGGALCCSQACHISIRTIAKAKNRNRR
ncbi:MAG: hypothetical protein HZA69_02120 [Gammaproteobacteria bacterium]|nr:hypothetical protein [Gammaproteobacteria bacterium]